MAHTVGVSKSSVSREFVEASAWEIEKLFERCFDEVEILIMGWRDLWMLEAVLKEELVDVCVAAG